jgi:hypothetical protein
MRKNYFLSLFLLMTAFWNVNATDGSKSTSTARNIEATVPLGTSILNAPSGLVGFAVGGSGTRISLRWADNSVDETEFQVAYTVLTTGYSTILTDVPGSLDSYTYTLPGLQPSTTYYISVRAIKSTASIRPNSPTATDPCTYADDRTPTNPAPAGTIASCWTNVLTISTNPTIPEPATGATVATPYSQRRNVLYFTDNSNNETSFIIERSTGGDFTQIDEIASFEGTGLRSYVDNSTQPYTDYAYRVRPRNQAGDGFPETKTDFFRTLSDPPTAPTLELVRGGIGLNHIQTFWSNSLPRVIDYAVERSSDGANWSYLGSVAQNGDRSYRSDGLNEGTKYFFRVRARNDGGFSNFSNVVDATTLKKVVPNASSALTAKTISTTQIDLAWNLGIQDGVTNNRISQEIYRSSVSGTDGFSILTNTNLGDQKGTYSDNTCLPKTTYWYKVVSTNYQGQSAFSNVATATTLGPPYAPSDLTTVLTNDALGNAIIKATWKDNSSDEWGFSLERALDSTFTKSLFKADLDSNTVAATSIPIEEGVTYYYRINASNTYGASKYSAISMLTTDVTAAPNAPYGLKGTATAAEVALVWGDDSNKESAFEVERSDDGKTFAKIGAIARNEVAYSDKTVKEKTKYYYRVRATNDKGNSDYSNVVEITTLAKASASIELATDNVFQVYPNPTADGIKVTLSENMQKESGVITITDRMNREVSRTILNNQSEYRLDLSNFTEGAYTISLRTATQQITKRVYKF